MSTGTRAAAFVAVLGVVFAAAFGAGRLLDGDEAEPRAAHGHGDAFHLEFADPPTGSGTHPVRFTITDHDGAPVTDFEVKHEKRLHLIAVDTGYTGFQHLHPTMAADGTWTTTMDLAAGTVQVYADFRPLGGEDAVARTDLVVGGTPGSAAFSTLRTQQVDGYTVTVLGDLVAGGTSSLRFEISRNGQPVTDLQPHLGAYGHLVMLRKADGAYLHVHPEDGPAGPVITFAARVPSAARYHLYLDFRHGGVVRTAKFVLDAAGENEGQGGMGGHGDH